MINSRTAHHCVGWNRAVPLPRARRLTVAVTLAPVLLLAACGDEQVRTFGATRDSPGTTQTRSLPLLSVPPLLAQRPARDGVAAGPQDATAEDVADRNDSVAPPRRPGRAASAQASAAASRGQDSLVAAAGPAAPADIRQRITRDAQLETTDPALGDRILAAPGRTADTQGAIIQSTKSGGFWSTLF